MTAWADRAARPWSLMLREAVRGREVGVAYAAVVIAGELVLAALPAHVHESVVAASSTNLVNLRHRPYAVLAASAFVVNGPTGLWSMPALAWGYGSVQRWLGPTAAVLVGAFGHVGATLFVAAGTASGIARGVLDNSLAHADDVGVSYGLMSTAGVLLARVPRRWLPLYGAVVGSYLVGGIAVERSFTAAGHATAFLIGGSLALLVHRAQRAARA